MAYPVTLNGRTYTLADFEGTNYVDGLPDAFEDFVTHAGDIYNSTSTTSNSIGSGSKTFTVDSNKPYQAGTPLRIADAADPSANFLDCVVTSYSGTTLVVNAIGYSGSGTLTSWTVNIGGSANVAGTVPVAQGGTGATSAADARTNLDITITNVSGQSNTAVDFIDLPAGTTAERPGSPSTGYVRFNTDDTQFEGYDGSDWAPIGGGNTTDQPLWEHSATVSENYSLTTGNNALSSGPISVSTGITVTIPSGSVWTVV